MLGALGKTERLLLVVKRYSLASKGARLHVRVRFAPSPTGHLHLGGLRTALFNYLFAKQHGGQFILRIEDTDAERTVDGAAEAIQSCLQWLGLNPDESPSRGGPHGPYIQSKRLDIYTQAAKELLEKDKVYRCFCSKERLMLKRKEALRMGRDPGYDNMCRHLSNEEIASKLRSRQPFALRLKQKSQMVTFEDVVYGSHSFPVRDDIGDPILIKSDGYPTYHFASVIDDHDMQISHVLRGEEWLTSTPIHLQLYEAFQWKPPVFAHLPLILSLSGAKVSKREGMSLIDHYRERCFYPEAVVSFACFAGGGFVGDNDRLTLRSLEEYANLFDLKHVARRRPKLDIQWLQLLNRQALARKTDAELLAHTRHLIRRYVALEEQLSFSDSFILKVINHYKNEICTLAELFDNKRFFLWKMPTVPLQPAADQPPLVEVKHLDALIVALECLQDDRFQKKILTDLLCHVAADCGISTAHFMQFLRRVLTASRRGLPIAEVLEILGKNNCLQRLRIVRNCIASK
ncbi:glutamyl tRNA synthetase [Trichuris trichiura]|uniref:Nondiscriminating glutamyl-tRNA synthetase EARS2, mitochondrial n=1 Tax=Trichuris trichiura TaxID=36087 RepID=A0A077YXR2_TRITR|nr:glutamyl tRNA synthetase [Trichuris trichiura]